jgi:hypothetical protein
VYEEVRGVRVSEGQGEERKERGRIQERDSRTMEAFLRHYDIHYTLLNQGIVSTEGKASS